MVEENNVSSLQQHLEVGNAAAIEKALKLKATVGFPYSDYQYYSHDWDSESEYYSFINYGKTTSSISGRYYNSHTETPYETTIILYNGRYYVQVEIVSDYSGGSGYNCNSFPDYLSALKFAYDVVFN